MKLNHVLTSSTVALCALFSPMGAMASIQANVLINASGLENSAALAEEDLPMGEHFAKKGSDDRGGDSSRGRGSDDSGNDENGGDRSRSGGSDDSGDDDGGNHHNGADDNGSDDQDGSGRRERVPGGSGCDDPSDIVEHAECSV